MSNKHSFLLSPLDEAVKSLPLEERRQIMLDFDELERTGINGDTRLRHHAGEIYRKLQGRPTGFDASYMMFVGYSAHKVFAIETIESEQNLELDDQKTMALNLVRELAGAETLREVAISRAADTGAAASDSKELEVVIEHQLFDKRADINHIQADLAEDYILAARSILGVEPVSPEQELENFHNQISRQSDSPDPSC